VKDFDLDAARLVRLQQDLDALLPDNDLNLRQEILRWLSVGAQQGLDLIPLFRDALRSLQRHPPTSESAENGTSKSGNGSDLEMEALPAPHCATLWPYRPKPLPDELLSSWLWRTARGLSAPPRRFACDAIGARLPDIDRDIDDAAIARLAFLSGQSEEHLLRGTLRADAPIPSFDSRESILQALLRHGDLVLNRARRGRSAPIVQYCPVCLGRGDAAYLRRGWRFSLEVVCFNDGCFLLDSCWQCAALLDPLSQTVPCTEFLCVKCAAPLAKAPSVRMAESISDQLTLYYALDRLAFFFSRDFVGVEGQDYIVTLSSGDLRGTNPANAADRHNAVMLEAWRLRQVIAEATRVRAAQTKARAKRRKIVTTPTASQATVSPI
jgi:hypothetical protein